MPQNTNTLVGLVIFFFTLLLCTFITSLFNSKAGEVASALGGIIGGAVGAIGAALAVYLTLRGQRDDEAEKTLIAIIMEIAFLAKYVAGKLELCTKVLKGEFSCPRGGLPIVMFIPSPVIYPIVADRISRLSRPALVVSFYTTLMEIQGCMNVIVYAKGDDMIAARDIRGLAILLREQCNYAKLVLEDASRLRARETGLSAEQLKAVINMLDESIAKADQNFPSFDEYVRTTD
ncbi:hypothetical protein [Rhodoplanes roseus]|uniref:hypothetical protein n=1 Tax=Rhodoplanes roseus TaxID=29409 RepID=UPI0011B5CFFA|nr:hypothetical protein [Rhodoplanes roseus]